MKLSVKRLLTKFGISNSESLVYQVKNKTQSYEIRSYEPYIIASVVSPGPFRQAKKTSFRKLASYIFGDNKSSAHSKIAMTAPVLQE